MWRWARARLRGLTGDETSRNVFVRWFKEQKKFALESRPQVAVVEIVHEPRVSIR